MSKWLSSLALLVAMTAAGRAEPSPVASKDGTVEITLPADWQSVPEDSPLRQEVPGDNKVFVRRADDTAFAIAFRESKEDIAITTLGAYAALVFKAVEQKFPDPTIGPPMRKKIGRVDALQFEMRGVKSGINLFFIKTFMASPTHWIQTTCWTTPSHRKELDKDCAMINASFKALK